MEEIELTILIPCLNEEKTIEKCLKKAITFLSQNNINGEILVIDNGSTDNSRKIAEKHARVEYVEKKGYGSALINGSKLSKGKYVIMGDADDSYNFLEIYPIYSKLKEGYDLVIGNRFKGNIQKGAMKFSHKYIGTPLLSKLIQFKYNIKIGDINCGLRGYNKEKILNLNLQSIGMEYASEMVIEAQRKNLKILELPISFYKDSRNSKSHLRTIRDGMRHLKLICSYK